MLRYPVEGTVIYRLFHDLIDHLCVMGTENKKLVFGFGFLQIFPRDERNGSVAVQ